MGVAIKTAVPLPGRPRHFAARALWARGGTLGLERHVLVDAEVVLAPLEDETRTAGSPMRRLRLEVHFYGMEERGAIHAVLWPDEAETLPTDVLLNSPAPIPCSDVYVRRNGLTQPLGAPDMSVHLYWEAAADASKHLVLTDGKLLRAEVTLACGDDEYGQIAALLRPRAAVYVERGEA